MPLAVSEIGIRMAVGNAAQGSEAHGAGGNGGGDEQLSPQQVEEIVARSVQRVLAALRMQQER